MNIKFLSASPTGPCVHVRVALEFPTSLAPEEALTKITAAARKAAQKLEAEYFETPAGIIEPLFLGSIETSNYLRAVGSGFMLAATVQGQTLEQVTAAVTARTGQLTQRPLKAAAASAKLLAYYAKESARRDADQVATEIVTAIDAALESVGELGVD